MPTTRKTASKSTAASPKRKSEGWLAILPAAAAPFVVGRYAEVHDNGGRPFGVKMQGDAVIVAEHDVDHARPKFTDIVRLGGEGGGAKVAKVWVGHGDDANPTGMGHDTVGNAVLVEYASHIKAGGKREEAEERVRCVYIGASVFGFFVDGPLTSFVAHVGNSDVTYAYATTARHAYFFQDDDSYWLVRSDVTRVPLAALTKALGVRKLTPQTDVYAALYDDATVRETRERLRSYVIRRRRGWDDQAAMDAQFGVERLDAEGRPVAAAEAVGNKD